MLESTPEEFSREVENKVNTMGDGYIEAILSLCDTYQVEPSLASKYLSKSITMNHSLMSLNTQNQLSTNYTTKD